MQYKIYFQNNSVFCNTAIFDGTEIISLSIVGRQNTVKAIQAGLTSRKSVSLKNDSLSVYKILKRPDRKCSFKIISVGDGLFQGVFYDIENKNLITVEQEFFNAIDALYEIPIHPSWASFIWQTGIDKGKIRKLDMIAEYEMEDHFIVDFNQDELLEIIKSNISLLSSMIN